MKNQLRIAIAASILGLISVSTAQTNDYLFPQKGRSLITMATGVPYIGTAEYAYGFSERFSAGILIANVPGAETVAGARFRYLLYQPNWRFRTYVRMPVIYYSPMPTVFCGNPWVVAWPTVNAEWTFDSGTRITAGMGVIGASCVHHLVGHTVEGADPNAQMSGIWHTATIGITLPVTNSMIFHAEASPVMTKFRLAGKDWVAQVPVIAVIGLSYSF